MGKSLLPVDEVISLTAEAHALREATLEKIALIELQRKRSTNQFRVMLGVIILALGGLFFLVYQNNTLGKDSHEVAQFVRQINTTNSCYQQFNKWGSEVFKLQLENDNRLIHEQPLKPYPKTPTCKLKGVNP